MLTGEMRKCLDFISAYQKASEGVSPSYQEVAWHLGTVKSRVHRVIGVLERHGHIRRIGGRHRAIEVLGVSGAKPFVCYQRAVYFRWDEDDKVLKPWQPRTT